MKYDDFKIFKLSTILKIIDIRSYNFSRIYKNINFKRYKYILVYVVDFVILIIRHIFSGFHKSINFIRYMSFRIYRYLYIRRHNFYRILKYLDIRRYNFSKIYRSLNIRRYNFSKIYRSLNIRRYNFSKIYKYLNIKKYKYVPVYVAGTVVFAAFIYLNIPMFFNYDKSKLENTICKNLNIKCSIQGKINYSFYPSPRIKIKDLIIQDFVDKKKTFGKIENVAIKLSLYNLSNKNKSNFTKIELRDAKINFDLHELKEYKNFFKKKFNSKPINLKKGEIKFFDGEKDIATIRDANFKYKTNKNTDDVILKGNFLNKDFYINFYSLFFYYYFCWILI